MRIAQVVASYHPKIAVIPNFFDTASIEAGVAPVKPTVLFVGPDCPHKGRVVAIIDAFSRLPAGATKQK